MLCPRVDSPIMRPVPGDPSKPKNCSKKTAAHGAGRAKRKSTSVAAPPWRTEPESSRESRAFESRTGNRCGGRRYRMTDDRANADARILQGAATIAKRAAEEFIKSANAAAKARGSFSICLAGGSTPKALYALLVSDPLRGQLPWEKMQLFFGDERHVEPTHPDSNFRMATEAMIFMVAGADKALALKAVLEGPYEPEQLPAQLINPKNGRLLWLVDAAAGGILSRGIRE